MYDRQNHRTISLIMCAVPFFIIAQFDKNSKTPINFWAGVKDVEDYNKEMAALYQKCAIAFLLCGIVFFVFPVAGVVVLVLICTVGIYIVYREYKKILSKFS